MFIIIIISITIATYSTVRLFMHDSFYNKAQNITDIDIKSLDNYNGFLIVMSKNEMLNGIDVFKHIYKNVSTKGERTQVLTYNENISEAEVNFFKKFNVNFVPCVIEINGKHNKKYILYKVEDFENE